MSSFEYNLKLTYTWKTPSFSQILFSSLFFIGAHLRNHLSKFFTSCSTISLLTFAYNSLYIIFKSIIKFFCLSRLFISLVAMDSSCKTYVETDLISLHYVTFIEPLVVYPTEALSFDSDEFMNNNINKVIEEKTNESFVLLNEHFFIDFLVHKKTLQI
jgi:hypothetical protein